MPPRINSFVISGIVFVLLATIAASFDSPAWAKDDCIEHPPQPVAEDAHRSVHNDYGACNSCHAAGPEVSHWQARYDRAKGRKCWFLADAEGHDLTDAHGAETAAPRPTQTFSSTIASLFNGFSFTGKSFPEVASANAAPAGDAPASSSRDSARRRQGNGAEANKTDNGVRVNLKSNSEGQAAKRVSQVSFSPEDRDLFVEFLRWQEINKALDHRETESRREAGSQPPPR
jgi:hypothetical protein